MNFNPRDPADWLGVTALVLIVLSMMAGTLALWVAVTRWIFRF